MNKGKYANQRKQEKKEKKAKFLDYSEQLWIRKMKDNYL
jgi:hypothetical protein